jgi:AcrR family transcriptional regulator
VPPTDRAATGLRERKKARTRADIQAHAMRLFRLQGYEATTVAQIIEEAEVSESTFFRYFPTKADLVVADDFDLMIVEAFAAQPAEVGVLRALRASFRTTFVEISPEVQEEQRERMALSLSVPELQGPRLVQFASVMSLLAGIAAERTGRPPQDPAIRTLAGAVVGAAVAVAFAATEDPSVNLAAQLDDALALLEDGLTL